MYANIPVAGQMYIYLHSTLSVRVNFSSELFCTVQNMCGCTFQKEFMPLINKEPSSRINSKSLERSGSLGLKNSGCSGQRQFQLQACALDFLGEVCAIHRSLESKVVIARTQVSWEGARGFSFEQSPQFLLVLRTWLLVRSRWQDHL